MTTQQDKEIIIKIRQGEIDSFSLIVKKYTSRIYGFINSKLFKKADTDDLVQNVFISFYKAIGRFDYNRKILPYLFEIAKNELKMYYRSHKSVLPLKEEITSEEYSDTFINSIDFKELKIPDKEMLIQIADGYTYEELAKKYKMSVNTIKSKIRRTRLKLKKIFYEKS